ncbi:MAG: hypothetical protein JRJ45_03585 [Deltaproteobacteria bacterium]|nr:hypothetical protein [Deltaproteobacteria bacterium]
MSIRTCDGPTLRTVASAANLVARGAHARIAFSYFSLPPVQKSILLDKSSFFEFIGVITAVELKLAKGNEQR